MVEPTGERSLTPRESFEQTGVIPRLWVFEEIGSTQCHFSLQSAEFRGLTPQAATSIATFDGSAVILSRLRNLQGMRGGSEFRFVVDGVKQYHDQFFAFARWVDSKWHSLDENYDHGSVDYNAASGLMAEAVFFRLSRVLKMPITICSMSDDRAGRDMQLSDENGLTISYLDISVSTNTRGIQKKAEGRRDAVPFVIPVGMGHYHSRSQDFSSYLLDLFDQLPLCETRDLLLEDLAYGRVDKETPVFWPFGVNEEGLPMYDSKRSPKIARGLLARLVRYNRDLTQRLIDNHVITDQQRTSRLSVYTKLDKYGSYEDWLEVNKYEYV